MFARSIVIFKNQKPMKRVKRAREREFVATDCFLIAKRKNKHSSKLDHNMQTLSDSFFIKNH